MIMKDGNPLSEKGPAVTAQPVYRWCPNESALAFLG